MIKTHIPCDQCGSSDAAADYGTYTHCYSCGSHKFKQQEEEIPVPKLTDNKIHSIPNTFERIGSRNISKEACEKYGVWLRADGAHVYPYYSRNSTTHIANKVRKANEKAFFTEGDISKTCLFGQQAFNPEGKYLTIVEGELDCLAVYDMFGQKYPCVSIQSAASAERDISQNFEYVNSFDNIVICFDKDEPHYRPDGTVFYPGQEAAIKVANMLPLGKVRILTLKEHKDANDYLLNNKTKQFIEEWWKAPSYTPAGLRYAKDLYEEVAHQKNYETVPYPWEGLNALTYGIRLSELVVFTADSGIGKTQVLREVIHYILSNTERGLGLAFLEETNGDTLLGLMSISCNRPLHLPDVRSTVDTDTFKRAWADTCDTERLVLWDHFGSNDVDDLIAKIRHMSALGCKYIFLDHLSIVVSDQHGDERKQLDEISTKLKTICMELNIAVICVIHQNRKGEIRGTAGVEQLANIVIKLFRNKESDDELERNTTKVLVQKNRFSGKTGPACYLYYDSETGRLSELTLEQVTKIEPQFKTKETDDSW